MKSLYTYIIESSKKYKDILTSAKEIHEWWSKNFKGYYDHKHGEDENNLKKCELLNNKKVKADCAGFIGAVLCFAGYTNNPLAFSVKFGSFNLDGHINNQKENEEVPSYIDIEYMKDMKGNWHSYKLKDINKWPECKPGDILYSSGHIAILGENEELYQCTQYSSGEDRHFRAYWRLEE